MQIAPKIDHTYLKPDCTEDTIRQICAEALQYGFAAVCIPPFYVNLAAEILTESSVAVSTVIGFPMGYACTAAKVEEIKKAVHDGAEEVDVVVNLCAVKSQRWNYVHNDIDSMTRAAHLNGKIIKVIIETGLLEPAEIKKLCSICSELEVDYVKTSTGFNGPGASVEIVQKLRKCLPKGIKIKASGGIRTTEQAEALLHAGADRLGTSSGTLLIHSKT